ncbi:MAG: PAS domain S-box protein [Planctomycetes bacterium]|nr:PAS domain S-box protein [Planctomycetota bacterium]
MRGELLVVRGEGIGRKLAVLPGSKLTLGRSPECALQVIDPGVSATHCRVDGTIEEHVLVDLGSRNGTYVNGNRVECHPLASGDLVVLGATVLEYKRTDEETPGKKTTKLLTVETPWKPDSASVCDRIIARGPEFWDRLPLGDEAARGRKLGKLLGAIHQVAGLAHGPATLEGVVSLGLDLTLAALGGDRAAVVLLPREPGFLGLQCVRRGLSTDPTTRMIISKTVVDTCQRDGVSVLSSFGLNAIATQSVIQAGIRAAMCVPIESETSILGVFYVDSLTDPACFIRSDLEMLAAIASLLGTITEKRILESRMRETEQRLATVLAHVPVGILVTDAQGRLSLWSRHCERLLGRNSAEVVGLAGLELLLGSAEGARAALARSETGKEYQEEREFVRKDGATFVGSFTLRRLADAAGRPAGHVGILLDVTDRRLLEEQLAQEERSALLGLMVAGVTHDMRNQLTPLLGYADLAERKPGYEARLISAVRTCTGKVMELTASLLTFAREPEGEARSVDLPALVESTIGLVSSQLYHRGIVLTRGPTEPVTLRGVATELQNVFVTIILSAKRAMPRGGSIEISVSRDSSHARVAFAAKGPGDAQDLLRGAWAPLVEPPRRTKAPSEDGPEAGERALQVALHVSGEAVRRQGGEVRCAPDAEGLTRVLLLLPFSPPAAPAATATSEGEPGPSPAGAESGP